MMKFDLFLNRQHKSLFIYAAMDPSPLISLVEISLSVAEKILGFNILRAWQSLCSCYLDYLYTLSVSRFKEVTNKNLADFKIV